MEISRINQRMLVFKTGKDFWTCPLVKVTEWTASRWIGKVCFKEWVSSFTGFGWSCPGKQSSTSATVTRTEILNCCSLCSKVILAALGWEYRNKGPVMEFQGRMVCGESAGWLLMSWHAGCGKGGGNDWTGMWSTCWVPCSWCILQKVYYMIEGVEWSGVLHFALFWMVLSFLSIVEATLMQAGGEYSYPCICQGVNHLPQDTQSLTCPCKMTLLLLILVTIVITTTFVQTAQQIEWLLCFSDGAIEFLEKLSIELGLPCKKIEVSDKPLLNTVE